MSTAKSFKVSDVHWFSLDTKRLAKDASCLQRYGGGVSFDICGPTTGWEEDSTACLLGAFDDAFSSTFLVFCAMKSAAFYIVSFALWASFSIFFS
jgi:hypothetical protein